MNINQNAEAPQYVTGYRNLKAYILNKLGYPTVRVELTETQIIQCIIDAITWFTKYSGEIEYKVIIVEPNGSNIIDIPDDPDYVEFADASVDPFADPATTTPTQKKLKHTSIVDVIFFSSTLDRLSKALFSGGLTGGFEDGVIPLNNYFSAGSSYISDFDITTYYLYVQKLEDFKKALGLKQTWEILNGQIYLSPGDYRWTEPVGILYKPAITESDAEQEMWIKSMALAEAKIVLGTIRRKLSGFNSGGMNIAADGDTLVTEGKEEKADLLEKLQLMGPPLPFLQD